MSRKQGTPPCEHTVEPRDTFSSLAQAYYGDGSDVNAQKIASANPDVSPTSLTIGQKLQIPEATPILTPNPIPAPSPGETGSSQPYKMVAYFENWAQYRPESNGKFLPEDIDPSLLTHINFAFAIFGFYTWSVKPDKPEEVIPGEARYTGDYTIQPVEWNDQTALYPGIQKLKERNPSLKTFISIGGWSFNSGDDKPNEGTPHPFGPYTYKLFSQMASSPSGRQQFISSAIQYSHNYGFDGIDIDWEYPGDPQRGGNVGDFQNFLSLLEEFRNAINKPENWKNGNKLLLTIAARAIPPSGEGVPDRYLERCASYLDWMNLMTYDFHGAWESITGVNAPLLKDSTSGGSFSIQASVTAHLSANVPKEKIVLGVPTYGRTFTVTSSLTPDDNGFGKSAVGNGGPPGHSTKTPGFLAYYEILKRQSSSELPLTPHWDNTTSTPYAYNSTTGEWVTYDDPTSIAYKVQYMVGQGLAGVMVWALGQDDFNHGFPLLQTINKNLQQAVQAQALTIPGKRYDEITFLTAHNAYANRHDGWDYFQQDHTVAEQLSNGVRALMLDVHIRNGDVVLLHVGNDLVDQRILLSDTPKKLSETLRTIKNFLDINPTEVVTLILESYVRDSNRMKKAFDDAGIWNYIFFPSTEQKVWPTLEEMVKRNKRLVVFSDKGADGFAYVWDYAIENVYGNDSINLPTCAMNRAESLPLNDPNRSLFIQNYFPTFHLGYIRPEVGITAGFTIVLAAGIAALLELPILAPLVALIAGIGVISAAVFGIAHEMYNDFNNPYFIMQYIEACIKVSHRKPNFLAVDFYHMGRNGGPMQVVRALNGEPFHGNISSAAGLATFYPINLSQVQAIRLQDGDLIKLDIEHNACPPDKVQMELKLGSDVTWWKGLLLLKTDGGATNDGMIEVVNDKKQSLLTIDCNLLLTRSLVLSKAKFLGAHENKYWIRDAATAIEGGNRYTFTWEKD